MLKLRFSTPGSSREISKSQKIVVVAAAEDHDVLAATVHAKQEGIVGGPLAIGGAMFEKAYYTCP